MNPRFQNLIAFCAVITAVVLSLFFTAIAIEYRPEVYLRQTDLPGWRTNTARSIISITELTPGGTAKDGIPAITSPKFESPFEVLRWLPDREPVMTVKLGRTTKAYPLQILLWHEIINDRINGVPVVVTFCPLSHTAMAYKRSVNGQVLTFGVSGMLRNSGMIMFDTRTETLWQQFNGRALVGDLAGKTLQPIPSQIISFGQFTRTCRKSCILSRKTGYQRPYGENPYVGYDDASSVPPMFTGQVLASLPPMEKVIALEIDGLPIAYPNYITAAKGVINDEVCDHPIAVFHNSGAVAALDRQWIRNSRQIGSTAVFSRILEGHRLTFAYDGKYFIDLQTRSTWTITGTAIEGPLKGEQLTPIIHKNCFAFAWLAFNPKTQIYK